MTRFWDKLQMKSIAGIHPVVIFAVSIIGSCFFFVTTFSRKTFPVDTPHFQLARSSAFNKIVECSDTSDGLSCFQSHRPDLEKEAILNGISSISQAHLASCLDLVSKNANDLALLLNIQTCFHQTDILDRAIDFNNTTPKTSWWIVLGIILSLFIQFFIAIHSFVTFVLRNKELDHQNKNIRQLAQNFELLNEKQMELYSTVTDLVTNVKSETRNLQGRLNRGGDVRREIEKINQTINLNTKDLQILRDSIYSPSSYKLQHDPSTLHHGVDNQVACSYSDFLSQEADAPRYHLYSFTNPPTNVSSRYTDNSASEYNQFIHPKQNINNSIELKKNLQNKDKTKPISNNSNSASISDSSRSAKGENQKKVVSGDQKSDIKTILSDENGKDFKSFKGQKYQKDHPQVKVSFKLVNSQKTKNRFSKDDSELGPSEIAPNLKSFTSGINIKIGSESFDLSTPEGKLKWQAFIQKKNTAGQKATQNISNKTTKTLDHGSNNSETDIREDGQSSGIISNKENDEDSTSKISLPGINELLSGISNGQCKKQSETSTAQADVTQQKVVVDKKLEGLSPDIFSQLERFSKEGKKYRRIFVPGSGWVSSKKVENAALYFNSA